MYLKLSMRNAKRSFADYLLYITSMIILISTMETTNCLAIVGKIEVGFQTVSLPILITIIMILLVGYMNTFMLRQRAKEFANYIMLGMSKDKLSYMFLMEIFLINFVCFLVGNIAGLGVFGLIFLGHYISVANFSLIIPQSLFYTFFYFCIVEILCAIHLRLRIGKLQIRELIYEKERNETMQNSSNTRIRGIIFAISFIVFAGIMCMISFLPGQSSLKLISIISIPMLVSIFAFYKLLMNFLCEKRKEPTVNLYQDNRLYIAAQITSNFKTTAIFNSIFSVCLLFSALSFLFGMLMFRREFQIFDLTNQQWMGILQISICIIFIVIYFSMLSFHQIIELKREIRSFRILFYLGKNSRQVIKIMKQQIAIKLFIPMIMPFFVLLISTPVINKLVNNLSTITKKNMVNQYMELFMLYVLIFYLCYFLVLYIMSKKYVKTFINN